MSYIATLQNKDTLDFINGNLEMSILESRYHHLRHLNYISNNTLKISCRNTDTDAWTKWEDFPGMLMEKGLMPTIDVHRSVLPNEIVIESDYPEYDKNYKAARLIGEIIESKGFQPLYYFSGSKSIHIHVFFDFNCIATCEDILNEQLRVMYSGSEIKFKKEFILWLRELMINCWNTKFVEFDKAFIKSSHLIRSEMSRNKKGYKTFLGYTYKDISFIPKICNEENRIYPELGELKLSTPIDINGLLEEFIEQRTKKTKAEVLRSKHIALSKFFNVEEKIRPCVTQLMKMNLNDGTQRAMFILVNEFKRVYGVDMARKVICDWNNTLPTRIKDSDIEIRLKQKNYNLSDKYIIDFISELNNNIEKCNANI